jgi:hypothetical protein
VRLSLVLPKRRRVTPSGARRTRWPSNGAAPPQGRTRGTARVRDAAKENKDEAGDAERRPELGKCDDRDPAQRDVVGRHPATRRAVPHPLERDSHERSDPDRREDDHTRPAGQRDERHRRVRPRDEEVDAGVVEPGEYAGLLDRPAPAVQERARAQQCRDRERIDERRPRGETARRGRDEQDAERERHEEAVEMRQAAQERFDGLFGDRLGNGRLGHRGQVTEALACSYRRLARGVAPGRELRGFGSTAPRRTRRRPPRSPR